ncbi:hypothetical protein [Corynebacterium diphtheriae]|uniref:hypothetical protein n=1 Tax=Corynebacterium diphtheriae TaxID=1717 RepID=UPI000390BDF9|nr:hypothetical protein [Corynebacterium diphtheriae]ERA50326.1 hypothetical protein B178_09411 [Corynebacterium diphtheriae DSM 43988]UEB34942.1 hypothetical protein LK418_10135 [Corynebacterium diphtheriae subsp. diphtheriae]UEB40683.1 hypothetical protein LK405_08500 [Corynebacterium diphtheriae]UFX13938.1 hypothetical protein LRM94_10045 [Corynebacterium diphtheriae]
MSSSIPSAAPQSTVIVTVIEAESVEPIEPHMRAAKKTMSKRRKGILAYIRHTNNAP